MTSVYGKLFRISTFGESHGPAVGVILDGCPAGVVIDEAEIQADLDRRRPGQSRLVTQRKEGDEVEILSGVFEGHSTGTPIAMMVRNADQRPGAYDHLKDVFRPSHADYSYLAKYGRRDHRGGGRSSARETIGRVAAAAIARRWLGDVHGVSVLGWVEQVHDIDANVDRNTVSLAEVEASPTRCPDPAAAEQMVEAIEAARKRGDSLGGTVGFVARGVPAGWGEPVFDRLEADLGKGILSLPACKAFEIGSGFAGTRMTGLEHNDAYVPPTEAPGRPGPRYQFLRGSAGRYQRGGACVRASRVQTDGHYFVRTEHSDHRSGSNHSCGKRPTRPLRPTAGGSDGRGHGATHPGRSRPTAGSP